jgi:hypothetical protein
MLAGAALFFAALTSARAESDAAAGKLDLIPENATLWRESDLWDKDITLRVGVGYKDNVLLGPPKGTVFLTSGLRADAPRGSPFFTSGLDLTILRLPLDGLAFNFTVIGDDVRYWGNAGVDHEDVFVGSAEVKKYLGNGWQTGLEFRESYVDQIQYVILQTGPESTKVNGHLLQALPAIRRNLGTNWWAQVAAEVTREYFAMPLDDSWQFGPRLGLGRTYGFDSSAVLNYGVFHQTHDSQPATDSAGNGRRGTRRAFWKQEVELRNDQVWDARKHWRSITRLGFQYEEDNGAGFFNYYGYSASEELRYQGKTWQLRFAGKVGYQDYFKQRIVPDILASPTLYRMPFELSARAELRVYKTLKLYAQYEYEQVLSNLASDEYEANIVTGGINWAF